MKKTVALAVLAAGIATLASARNRTHAVEARYRIDLAGNIVILAKDQPVARGSVLMFHRSSDGILTSVPSEEVASVRRLSAEQVVPAAGVTGTVRRGTSPAAAVADQPLQPGQTLVLGTTGDAPVAPGAIAPASAAGSQANIQGRQVLDNQVFPGDLPAPGANGAAGAAPGTPGYVAPSMAINPTLNPAGTGTAATATTGVGANGFPTTATGAPSGANPINPNGFPATTTTGPQSGTNPINPNGFPATTTTGPQSGTQPVGANGFPTLAPATSPAPAAGTGTPANAPATNTNANTGTTTSSTAVPAQSAAPASGAKSGGSGH